MTGYRVHGSGTAGEAAILATEKLTKDQVLKALTLHAEREKLAIGTIIGVTRDGLVFTPTENWDESRPDAFSNLHIVLWVTLHELLGHVPDGTTDKFLKGGRRT